MTFVLLTIALSALAGLAITLTIDRDLRGFTLAGASILAGVGYMALSLFFMSTLLIPWTRTALVVAWLLPMLLFLRLRLWSTGFSRSDRLKPVLYRFTLVDILLLALILGHAIFATWAPMYEWDWFGIWGLKAKRFFEIRGIDWRFIQWYLVHPDYPLLAPLMIDLPSIARRAWEERFVGLMYTALSSGLVLIARGLLAEELESDFWGSLGTLAIASPALNLWIGLAEGPVAAYGCAGLLLVRRGLTRASNSSIHLGAVFLGLAAWSKNEGLALTGMAIVALTLASWRKAWRLLPALAIAGVWMITRSQLHLRTDFMAGDVLDRVTTQLRHFGFFLRALVVYAPDLRVFWIGCFLTLIVFARRAWTHERFLTVALLLQAVLMAAQALATRADIRAHIQYAWNRLPHQIAPAFGFLAVALLMPALLSSGRANER